MQIKIYKNFILKKMQFRTKILTYLLRIFSSLVTYFDFLNWKFWVAQFLLAGTVGEQQLVLNSVLSKYKRWLAI